MLKFGDSDNGEKDKFEESNWNLYGRGSYIIVLRINNDYLFVLLIVD